MFSYAMFYLQQIKEGRRPKFSYVKFFLIFLKKTDCQELWELWWTKEGNGSAVVFC
jgi:hypothetical protein